jgi:hypothetical protein
MTRNWEEKDSPEEVDSIDTDFDFTITAVKYGWFNIEWKNGKKELVSGNQLNQLKNDFSWNTAIKSAE